MSTLAFEAQVPSALKSADDLPSLPAVALEVLRLTQDADSTVDDLADCLSRDPALAAKILKLSNSAMFNMGAEITTLQRATVVLGLKTVKLMSLSFSLVDSIPSSGAEGNFSFEEYWHRSLLRSVSAQSLAQLVGSSQRDEAFLLGLLTHFGRLVLARAFKEHYDAVLEESEGWPSVELEVERMGFSNADLCATMLKEWNIPEVIYLAVGYANRPDEMPDDASPEVTELVHLQRITALMESVLCDAEKGLAFQQLHETMREHHGLSAGEVEEFVVSLEALIAEAGELLSVVPAQGESHADIMNVARVQMVNVSLGQAVDLKEANKDREQLAEDKEKLLTRATTDKLTGLPNRSFFDDYLESAIQSRMEGPEPLALGLVMIDVDKFKIFNDTHGHAAGDEVLRVLGQVLATETRKGDVAARYGGEEFAIIAPHTNPFNLRIMADRVRVAIEETTVEFEEQSLKVTASMGCACIAKFDSVEEGQKLIKLADSFLYRAKEKGRNRCETYRKMHFPGS